MRVWAQPLPTGRWPSFYSSLVSHSWKQHFAVFIPKVRRRWENKPFTCSSRLLSRGRPEVAAHLWRLLLKGTPVRTSHHLWVVFRRWTLPRMTVCWNCWNSLCRGRQRVVELFLKHLQLNPVLPLPTIELRTRTETVTARMVCSFSWLFTCLRFEWLFGFSDANWTACWHSFFFFLNSWISFF